MPVCKIIDYENIEKETCKVCKTSEEEKLKVLESLENMSDEELEILEGVVIDEATAELTPCKRIKGTNLYFSEGIIGALTPEQVQKYCKAGVVEIERPKLREWHKKFKEAIKECKLKTKELTGAEKIVKRIECMKEKLKGE